MAKPVYFTADLHFGHNSIIKFAKRPFSDVQSMDRTLIALWNVTVQPRDAVYCLGDVSLNSGYFVYEILKQLNGRIYVVPGGHDRRWLKYHKKHTLTSKCGIPIEVLPPLSTVMFHVAHRPQPIVLCHYPLARWDRQQYGSWHLHGHSHGRYDTDDKAWDVGTDCHRFAPVSIDTVAAYFAYLDAAVADAKQESGERGSSEGCS